MLIYSGFLDLFIMMVLKRTLATQPFVAKIFIRSLDIGALAVL